MLYAALVCAVLAILFALRAQRRLNGLEAELSRLRSQVHANAELAGRAEFLERAVELALEGQLTREMLDEQRLFVDLDGAAASALVAKTAGLQVLDVRSPSEYASGHVPEARSLPIDRLEGELDALPREQAYLVYCAMGSRSAAAATLLTRRGFRRVYNLAHGIASWPGPRTTH